MPEQSFRKLTPMHEVPAQQKDSNQIVEVEFPKSNKRYSYVGSGNLRVGQEVKKAPVTHAISGTNYTAPVKVVATHNVVGANVGDKKGVIGGKVTTIPKELKYLPGAKEQQRNPQIDVKGEKVSLSDYMAKFDRTKMQKINILGEILKGEEDA